jgi:hypothetical protein
MRLPATHFLVSPDRNICHPEYPAIAPGREEVMKTASAALALLFAAK